MPKSPKDTAPLVVGKAYDFTLWLLPKVEGFPRSHRFTIGERLCAQGLDLLVFLTEAACASPNSSPSTPTPSPPNLDEIGRITVGWRKSSKKSSLSVPTRRIAVQAG